MRRYPGVFSEEICKPQDSNSKIAEDGADV
jgi:hypothetical protein